MATTIPEAVTTIPAGTLRLLLTSISYRAKARKSYGGSRQLFRAARRAPAAGLPRRVEGASRCALTADRCQIASRRADPVQVETLTPQQVRRVCTAGSVSALASDPHTAGADPAGLARSAICCTVWHGSITEMHPYIPYYNRAAVLTCTASRCGVGIWCALEVLWRCDTPQRCTDGIIAACVGLVSWAVERYKLQEKRL